MDITQIEAVASQLSAADRAGRRIDALEATPHDLHEAYAIQHVGHGLLDGDLTAWKIGCTSNAAQTALGVPHPVAGRYPADRLITSGDTVPVTSFPSPPLIEVEVGLRITRSLTAVPAEPLDLADAVVVVPCIELVTGRLDNWMMWPGPCIVADNVGAGRIVHGDPVEIDPRSLHTTPVSLALGGEEVSAATGAEALGHPLTVLAWLVEHALAHDLVIEADQLVITGTCSGVVPAPTGVEITGTVGPGSVTTTIV